MTQNDDVYRRAVLASSFWPVRDIDDIYENDQLMTEYSGFMQYMGDYYQVTPGWARAREEWWKMLQKIGNGEDVSVPICLEKMGKPVDAYGTKIRNAARYILGFCNACKIRKEIKSWKLTACTE